MHNFSQGKILRDDVNSRNEKKNFSQRPRIFVDLTSCREAPFSVSKTETLLSINEKKESNSNKKNPRFQIIFLLSERLENIFFSRFICRSIPLREKKYVSAYA